MVIGLDRNRKQDRMWWRGPSAIYPTDPAGQETTPRAMGQESMVMTRNQVWLRASPALRSG
jgi:hypothetical protein